MLKKFAVAGLCLAGLVIAQTGSVEMNCVIDDAGEVWVNGQQVVRPKKVGDPLADTTSFMIPIQQGRNAVAIKCHDGGWTGGICTSIDLVPIGTIDTVRSDAIDYRCADVRAVTTGTGADLSTVGYNAAGWIAPGDYGYLADDTGGNPKPFFERMGLEGANLFFHKAKWLWTPPTIYIRKQFTAGAATGNVYIRGNGFTYTLYLNGTQISQGLTEYTLDAALTSINGRALNNGAANVIAIQATCVDSVDFAFIKASCQWSSSGFARSDSTWKYSWSGPSGWNNVGFDDASWVPCGHKTAYDGKTDQLTSASWIWATDMWFRSEFDVPVVPVARRAAAVTNASVLGTQYFTLSGKRIADRAVNSMNGKMIVERTMMSNGQTVSRMVQAGK